MRALKTILIIFAALIGLWLLLSLFGPKVAHVERSITMKAAPEVIYEHMRFFKNMDEWGVWRKMDPNAKYELTGEDGTVGAKQSWDGEIVRQGSNTITALEPNKSMKTDLAFGDMMVSQVSMDLTSAGDSTRVDWILNGELPFIFRAAALFMGSGDVERAFETGLVNLKAICETKQGEADKVKAAIPAFTITTSEWPAKLFVGKRDVVNWADMKVFYGKNFSAGMAAVGKAGVQPSGARSAVYFEWNEKDMTADMIAGIPVPLEAKAKLKGLDVYETPASKALTIDYYGGYSGLMAPHTAMDEYIKANGIEHHSNVVEEYVSDPGSEPDSTKWLTRITYLVK